MERYGSVIQFSDTETEMLGVQAIDIEAVPQCIDGLRLAVDTHDERFTGLWDKYTGAGLTPVEQQEMLAARFAYHEIRLVCTALSDIIGAKTEVDSDFKQPD